MSNAIDPEVEGYDLLHQLGSGDKGVVYLAYDRDKDRKVAVKILNFDADKRAVRRFSQEADIGKLLDHEDITTVFASGTGDGGSWIAMEYVDGYELAHLIDDDTFGVDDRVQLLSRAALALHHAHQHDIIHRDIKPSNIFITKNGGIRVLDFGIARLEKRVLTQAGVVIGTPGYLSPEQSQGKPIDGRSDVFALGLVLYEALTDGTLPWIADDTTKLLMVRATEPPRPFKEHVAKKKLGLTDGDALLLHDIVHKSIATDPDERYASALDFAAALQGFLARTKEVDADGKTKAPVLTPDPEAWGTRKIEWAVKKSGIEADAADGPGDGSGPPWTAIIVVGLVVVGGLVWYFFGQ